MLLTLKDAVVLPAGIVTVIVVGVISVPCVVSCSILKVTIVSVTGGFSKVSVYVAGEPSATKVSPLRLIIVTSSRSGFSFEVSSKIVVITLSLPIVSSSYPPPVVPTISTL